MIVGQEFGVVQIGVMKGLLSEIIAFVMAAVSHGVGLERDVSRATNRLDFPKVLRL